MTLRNSSVFLLTALFAVAFATAPAEARRKRLKEPKEPQEPAEQLPPDFPIPPRSEKKAVNNAAKIVEKMQETWDAAKTYQAEFEQKVYEKRLGTAPETSIGTVSVSKPSRLRWQSTTDRGIQILDGQQMIVVQESRLRSNRIVDIYKNLKRTVDTRILRFLAGTAKFTEMYSAQLVADRKDHWEIKFTGHEDARETLVAEIDKKSYLVRSLISDAADVRTITKFTAAKTNILLDPKLFQYEKQPNDVVHQH